MSGDRQDSVAPCVTHTGGCHCGAVRFEIEAPAELALVDCNCSMCRRTGYLHLFVQRAHFRLLCGEAALAEYRFGSRVARHLYCRHCGIKSFYVPRSHPDAYSVNARCLEPGTATGQVIRPFDGAHWEDSIDGLRASTGVYQA